MAQRLKRWESPRREGRNDKGKGGSARQRQKQKQMKLLRQKLKDNSKGSNGSNSSNSNGSHSKTKTNPTKRGKRPNALPPLFIATSCMRDLQENQNLCFY